MQRKRTFRGGYKFGNLLGTPKALIRELGIPNEVVVPLRQGFGEEVPPIVKIGDKVRAGQIIGIDDDSCSSPIHATVNGVVKDIRLIEWRCKDVSAVVIESDGSHDWLKLDTNRDVLLNVSIIDKDPYEIGRILYLSGVASLGRSGFPTKYNTSSIQPNDVKNLIINAVNSEPYALSNDILLANSISKFLNGLDILRRALNDQTEVHIGIDDSDKDIIKKIETASNFNWLHVHPLKRKYPQDHDVVLTETILGREVPYNGSVTSMGVVVLDVQAVLHAYEAVVEGKPIIERILALGGHGLEESYFVKVRVGTPLRHIVPSVADPTENRYIYGGIMTGTVCSDPSLPVDRSASSIAILRENRDKQFLFFLKPGSDRSSFSNAFLSSLLPKRTRKIDTNLNGEYRPCIYCNYCESVCPVNLMPYLLSKYITHNMLEEASKYRILACIDCGLCTYVCPSKIPLMVHIQDGKNQLKEI